MSIQSEINRISGNVADALDAIEDKGVTVPAGSNSDDLADLIAQISGGGGAAAITIDDTPDAGGGTVRTITAVDISSDTVTAAHLETGYTAHDADGNAITGQLSPSSAPTLQTKTNISPTESSQTITADAGYDGLDSVQINAIPSSYVGSGVTQRSSSDLSASGATVTAPAGYYASAATKSVSSGSATAPASISGTSATVSTGTNTLTLTKSVSVTPSVTAGYVSSGTAGNSSVSLTASVTTKAAASYTPSTQTQTIAANQYLTGAQTINPIPSQYIIPSGNKEITANGNNIDVAAYSTVSVNVSGGSSKAIYMYQGLATRTANSYGSTSATVTVTKAGTYNISYIAVRGSSSGTMGTNLHIGATTGTNNQTFNNGTYGQYATLTNQQIAANTAVTIYATSGSTTRSIYVGQLIVQEV